MVITYKGQVETAFSLVITVFVMTGIIYGRRGKRPRTEVAQG
jgi:hypothetical protein